MPRTRPWISMDLAELGRINPFRLRLVEEPPDSSEYFVVSPDGGRLPVEAAGLQLVGAGQALLSLSTRWLAVVEREDPSGIPPPAEVRLLLRRREARLLARLLERHLDRLQDPPSWMSELRDSLHRLDGFLRWEEV